MRTITTVPADRFGGRAEFPADRLRLLSQACARTRNAYDIQESLHPNNWGQLALRSCVRQAYNGGMPRGGTCSIAGGGLTSRGEANVALR